MDNKYLKVRNHPNFVRDKESNAILNVDDISLNKYKQEREYFLKLKRENEQLKRDVTDIKEMLHKLMETK
jgi:hypothetical protein